MSKPVKEFTNEPVKWYTNCISGGSNRNVLMCRLSDIAYAWGDAYGCPGRRVHVSPSTYPDKKLYLCTGAARNGPYPDLKLDHKSLYDDFEGAKAVIMEPGLLAKLEKLLAENRLKEEARDAENKNEIESPYTDLLNALEVERLGFEERGRDPK